LTSFVYAQYGSNFGNSNPGYGGTGTSVSSEDYGYIGQNPVGGPSGSDGNSEVSPVFICTLLKYNFTISRYYWQTNPHFAQYK